MYEGKNIHYSQVDNKPLCSSSRKICRQRRLNGYAFCVRHILEDPSAPFKSCEFITRSKLQCSNPIPKDDSRQYCNSHLQQLGHASSSNKSARGKDRKTNAASSKASTPTTPGSAPSTPTTPPTPDTPYDSRMTLADRLKSKFNMCHQRENGPHDEDPDDPYAFPEPQLNQTARLITPPKTGTKLSGILSKGPPNAIVSRSPPTGNGVGLSESRAQTPMSGGSPTSAHSPVSTGGLSLKIQPGLKQTLGLKESPQPALDVQQTGLNQNSTGKLAQTGETSHRINKVEAAILSQVGLSPQPRSNNYTLTERVKDTDQDSAGPFTKKSGNSGASTIDNDKGDKCSGKSPVRRPGSSTPIAQLYPELAEKLERTRSKPDVKLKGDVKSKSSTKISRTMNRLQTKIAQNKIKDKLKKSEKVTAPLSLSLPNALTKEVAPNVTITPEMSALQAQLLSALPPRHPAMGENKFPFSSMVNMAPLMHKFGPGGDAGHNTVRQQLKQLSLERGRQPPPPYQYPPTAGGPPNLNVTAAAATLAAAAAAAAAKTAASQAVGDGLRSGGPGPVHAGGDGLRSGTTAWSGAHASPAPPYPHAAAAVHMSQHTATSPKDTKCEISSSASVSASTSHSLKGLPPPHPAPHLAPNLRNHAPHTLTPAHKHRQPHSNIATGQGTIPVRLKKRRHDVLSEAEARTKVKRHSAVKFYAYHASQRMNSKDVLPLGVASSGEESDMEEELPWQRTWFTVSSDDDNSEDDDEEDLAVYTRTAKLSLLRSRLRRRFNQLKKTQRDNKHCRTFQEKAIRALLVAISRSPSAARDAVRATRGQITTVHRAEDASHSKRPCKCRKEPSDSAPCDTTCATTCATHALPYTNHCVNHIMYNVDQQLFDYCTAKFSDNTQCCVPVFDVRHELPLCAEHAAKADNYSKCDLKPKKPRKKTKPSALTRPPKKGKKKKNQKKNVRPQKPIIDEHTARVHTTELATSAAALGSTDEGSTVSISPQSSPQQQAQQTPQQPVTMTTQTTSHTSATTVTGSHHGDKKDEPLALPDDKKTTPGHPVNEMMTSQNSRENVMSPPPDMRELVNDITKSLDTPTDELEQTLLPGVMGASLLPGLDDTDQTKFLDEHDLNEVLNKLPEEAFDIFTGITGEEGKNGEFEHVTEEFERALAEVSRNEKLTAAAAAAQSGEAAYMSETDEGDELTKQIADSILNSQHLDDADDQLDVSMPDVSMPDDLNDQNLSDLASSISAHDLNSMSHALTVSVLNSALDINNVPNGANMAAVGGVRPGMVPGMVVRPGVVGAGALRAQGGNVLSASPVVRPSSSVVPGVQRTQIRSDNNTQSHVRETTLRPQALNKQGALNGPVAHTMQLPPGTFPLLQGQLLQGPLVPGAGGTGGVVPITVQPRHPNAHTLNTHTPNTHTPNTGQRPPHGLLMQGPPNATVHGNVPNLQLNQMTKVTNMQRNPSSKVTKQKAGVPAPVVSVVGAPRTSSAGGIVQNLLQSPPIVAPPPVHQLQQRRPNILQSSRLNQQHNHQGVQQQQQRFQIQGHNILAQTPLRPPMGQPERGLRGPTHSTQYSIHLDGVKGQLHSAPMEGSREGKQDQVQERMPALQAQLQQGLGSAAGAHLKQLLPLELQKQLQNMTRNQMPGALGGGAAFSAQGAAAVVNSVGGEKAQPRSHLTGLFSPHPGGGPPSLASSPAALIPGHVNGSLLNATEQLKQLVSKSPKTMATNALNNGKKRTNRSRRSANNKQVGGAEVLTQNHVTFTANQSQQTATLPLLTANQIRADGGGLKLALPLQALLPSDVSTVLTTVNGTSQDVTKATAPVSVPAKRARSAKKPATQTNPV